MSKIGNIKRQPTPGADSLEQSQPSNELTSELTSKLEELGLLMEDLSGAVAAVAHKVTEIVDSYSGDAIGLIMQRYPDLSRNALERLDAIGRGKLLPAFALDSGIAAFQISKLPAATQAMILRDGVEVLKANGVHRKEYTDLNFQEIRQVFTEDGMRSVAQQRKFLNAVVLPQNKPRYSLDPNTITVTFYSACRFNAVELEELLTRLKELEVKRLQQTMKEAQTKARR